MLSQLGFRCCLRWSAEAGGYRGEEDSHGVGQDAAIAQDGEDGEQGRREDAVGHQEETLQAKQLYDFAYSLKTTAC